MHLYGLIGYPLGHSFSKRYFTEKFQREHISGAQYELFPIEAIEDFATLLEQNTAIKGLNVTIPYKQAVIPWLNALDPAAAEIGAVNCIRVESQGRLTGYNTDAIGFRQSLERKDNGQWATPNVKAIVLGNGGAAKAVFYVLKSLGIPYCVVSRKPNAAAGNEYTWEELSTQITHITQQNPEAPILIVHTTPVGMAPNIEDCPNFPFDLLNGKFLVFDLIYNPEETLLLQRARSKGAATLNGLEMLYLQADAAWGIWNNI